MSEPSQSTSVLPQLEHTISQKKPISANTQFTDLSSRFDQQQRNASKPIKGPVKAASEQPSLAMLATLGIKVRDFAYESKLPPIQPVYRHPRQIQPAVVRTRLKHLWTETGKSVPLSGPSSQQEPSQKKLERTSTEPEIRPTAGPNTRMRGFTNLDDFDHEYDSLHIDSQQSNVYPESPPHSQMPPSAFELQESEPYINTPLVTPKGSLQWPVPDTSNIPVSQMDAESRATTPKLPSRSQLGLSQISNTALSQRTAVPNPTSPLTSALSLASINDGSSSSKITIPTPPRPPQGKAAAGPDSSHEVHASTPPRILVKRYHLRKRPAPPSSPFSPTKPSSRMRSLRTRGAVTPPSRLQCASIQSSHSRMKAKAKGESSSPGSGTLRRNGQEKRRRVG